MYELYTPFRRDWQVFFFVFLFNQRVDAVNDELGGQGGQHDAEDFGNDGVDRFAHDSGQPRGDAEQAVIRQQDDGEREDDHHLAGDVAVVRAHQQDDGRDRSGAGDQRHGQRENGDVVCAFGFVFAGFFFVFFAEDHLQADDEQQNAARDPERRQRNAHRVQEFFTDESENDQNEKTDKARAFGDLFAVSFARAVGQRQKQRHIPDRIQNDEKHREHRNEKREKITHKICPFCIILNRIA